MRPKRGYYKRMRTGSIFLKRSEKAGEKSDGPLAPSATTAEEGQSRRSDAENRTDDVSIDRKFPNRILVPEIILAHVESKPYSEPAASKEKQLTVQGTPRVGPVQDVVNDAINHYVKILITKLFRETISDLITKVFQEIVSNFTKAYIKIFSRLSFDAFIKHLSKSPSKEIFDNLRVAFNSEVNANVAKGLRKPLRDPTHGSAKSSDLY